MTPHIHILAEHGRCSPTGDVALLCSNPMNPSMISRRLRAFARFFVFWSD